MGEYAWVTLATNDSYSLGALVLAHSIRAVGSKHDLVVLVTPGVTTAMRQKLAGVFNLVQDVNILDSRDESNLRLLQRPELGVTFTKLHCWRLTQYLRCVFLDADTLMLQNSDELFNRDEFSAAPDVGWPDCFNSGVFVYRPSANTYESLIQFALEKGSFDGGDQGLLNLFFSGWARSDISFHLPFIYNMCSTACYSYLPAFKQFGRDAKIVHFIGPQKPWLQYFNTETKQVQPSSDALHLREILQRWWDIFCSLIHPQLTPEMAGLAGAFAQLTLGVPRTPEQDALENVLRKQAWEVGNIDYLGKDSFENIWSKISETLGSWAPTDPMPSGAEPTPSTGPSVAGSGAITCTSESIIETCGSESASETPSAASTQSAPLQEEAKPVESPVVTTETPSDTTSTDAPKVDSTESSQEKIVSPVSEPAAIPASAEKSVAVTGDKAAESVKESEGAKQEIEAPVCPIPEKKEVKEGESKTLEPQAAISEGETKTAEAKPEVPAVETVAPATETKTVEPAPQATEQPKEAATVVEPQTTEAPEQSKDTVITEPVCALPEKKEETKEVVAKEVAPPQPVEAKSETSSQQEAPKETPPEQEATKVVSTGPEEPSVVPQVEATPKEPSSAPTKEPEAVAQTAEAAGQTATSPEKPKAEVSAPQPAVATPSPKKGSKTTPKEPAVAGSADTTKSESSKGPKTKVTEATPPTTPGSPLVEKTKEALAAEATIPDTPPPTEGASTPTPPPRKTDKPKKAATKPKK